MFSVYIAIQLVPTAAFVNGGGPPTALEIANRVKIVKPDSAVLEFAGAASFSFTARDTGAVGRLCRSRMIASTFAVWPERRAGPVRG